MSKSNSSSIETTNEAKKDDGAVNGPTVICGLAATVAFLCNLNTLGLVLSSPIYAPILKWAVGKLAGMKEAEKETKLDEDQTQTFDIDSKTSQAFSDLAKQCKELQHKVKDARFQIFEYEGQHLAGFWLNLERVASLLSKGYLNMRVANHLDLAGEYIMRSNAHKVPKPTDPRDIR